jgi:NADPH-dependent 2,4-dienoyl-CoA reductase/sulfur reductase-like enzyme
MHEALLMAADASFNKSRGVAVFLCPIAAGLILYLLVRSWARRGK